MINETRMNFMHQCHNAMLIERAAVCWIASCAIRSSCTAFSIRRSEFRAVTHFSSCTPARFNKDLQTHPYINTHAAAICGIRKCNIRAWPGGGWVGRGRAYVCVCVCWQLAAIRVKFFPSITIYCRFAWAGMHAHSKQYVGAQPSRSLVFIKFFRAPPPCFPAGDFYSQTLRCPLALHEPNDWHARESGRCQLLSSRISTILQPIYYLFIILYKSDRSWISSRDSFLRTATRVSWRD